MALEPEELADPAPFAGVPEELDSFGFEPVDSDDPDELEESPDDSPDDPLDPSADFGVPEAEPVRLSVR